MLFKLEVLILCLCIVVHLNSSLLIKTQSAAKSSNEVKIQSRIAYGDNATIAKHPYMVSLVGANCGGSLISSSCVLTAAHCVKGFSAKDMKIRAASVWPEKEGIVREVQRIDYSKSFDEYTIDMDVAVLKLAQPLEDNTVKAIELDYTEVDENDIITAAGWGDSEKNTGMLFAERHLQEAKLFVTKTKCNKKSLGYLVTENMFCVKGLHREQVCGGDSGGPAVRNGKQVGIVSWGDRKHCGNSGLPQVFTNLGSTLVKQYLREVTAKLNC